MVYVDFFRSLGFDFNVHLKPKTIAIEKEATLSEKLKDSVFFYHSPNNTSTSFYLITSTLDPSELEVLRKYVWNKNDADIIFYYADEDGEVSMLYAKYSPKVSNADSILEVFSTSQKDLTTIERIRHWQFESGVFWHNFHSFIDKAKYKGIDKELVATLKTLKEQLSGLLTPSIQDDNNRNEVVQALIDRTLYIKYLEDNHIINAYFYSHYFNDDQLDYKKLLESNPNTDINKLYKIIHEIFNNALFDQPAIDDAYLTGEVRNAVANSFSHDVNTGQLRLFDFRFDVLPVEFISYIYEVFLSEKQKENGIYYTPKKLAQLIVDDVIKEDKIGSILDPSSGSGMFLITGYQRLLEISQKQNLEPDDSIGKIKYRIQLLSENIFGIEKELTAQRFTLFSLSLQIFIGINPSDIKEFIAKQLTQSKKIDLFSEYSFFENIQHANTLNNFNKPFENKSFSYIVGNPPFFEIPNAEEFKNEISFLNAYQVAITDDTKKLAKNVVGKSQISQCFFLKIKDWSDEGTRFGFVSNSSNFYNDYSEVFQDYFYSHYGIEKIYELSRVKKILFEKAKESVVAMIFTNCLQERKIEYYPVDLGLFSEKPFELLIIQEDKAIAICQNELKNKKVRLRNFLVGNQFDFDFVYNALLKNDILSNYIITLEGCKSKINNGLQIVGKEQILSEFNISESGYKKLTKEERKHYNNAFKRKYTNATFSDDFPIPLLEPGDLYRFGYNSSPKRFLGNTSNFQRVRNKNIYALPKILINRTGKELKAAVSLNNIFYNFDVYSIFSKEQGDIYLYTALINSHFINYVIDLSFRKRVDGSYTKIGYDAILNIPVPREPNEAIVEEIADLSKGLSEGRYAYAKKAEQLNELIYNLFELSYWEKQRIKDYYLPKSKIGRKKNAIDSYKSTLKEIIGFYFEHPVTIEETSTDFNLIVAKISFGCSNNSPKVGKTKKYLLNEIFEQNPNANFLASQEKVFGKDCVYIIKEDINKNWTETKAFEDGHDILRHLIPNENGESVY